MWLATMRSYAIYSLTVSPTCLSVCDASSSGSKELPRPLLLAQPDQLDRTLSSFHGTELQTIQDGRKINIANERRGTRCSSSRSKLISAKKTVFGISCKAGWQILWISCKHTSSVVLSLQIIGHFAFRIKKQQNTWFYSAQYILEYAHLLNSFISIPSHLLCFRVKCGNGASPLPQTVTNNSLQIKSQQ